MPEPFNSPLSMQGVISQVFEEYLELEIDAPDGLEIDLGRDLWISRVELSGGWTGVIDLVGSDELVAAACGLMIGKSPARMSERERHEAWAEMGNLVAGLVLAGLPPEVALSSPHVQWVSENPRGEPLTASLVRVEGAPLALFLYAADQAPDLRRTP